MKRVLVAVGLIALAGCGSSREAEVRRDGEVVGAAKEACADDYKAKRLKTFVEYMQCINAAETPLAQRLQRLGYGDIHAVRAAGRIAIAEKVDRGIITPAQGDLELAQLDSTVSQNARTRMNSDMAASAAATRSYAPTYAPPVLRSTYDPPAPPVTCRTNPAIGGYGYGATTRCQ